MPSTNALFWQLRQLAARLHDDARQIEDILYYHPDLVAPLDLVKIISTYWSEDPRAIDLLTDSTLLDSESSVNLADHDPDDDQPDIEILASLRHMTPMHRSPGSKFTTAIYIYLTICPIFAPSYEITWENCDALSALFILPEVDSYGREVEFQYPEYTLAAIAGLRNELYARLYHPIDWA